MTNIYSPMKVGCQHGFQLKVKKLDDNAIVPKKANTSDAGYDLYAIEDVVIAERSRSIIRTGISMAIPNNYVGLVWPRSGLAVKAGIDVLAGVIDSGYRGEICVVLQNHTNHEYKIKKHDRAAQLLIQKITDVELILVEDLDETNRGTQGFGSSGK